MKFYSHREDWEQHMRLDHWRLWKCPFGCLHANHEFDTAEELVEHSSLTHGDEITQRYYKNLVQLCSVSDLGKARGNCPLLCGNYQIDGDKEYVDHVAEHLETLAVSSLEETLVVLKAKHGVDAHRGIVDHASRSAAGQGQVHHEAIGPMPRGQEYDAEWDGDSGVDMEDASQDADTHHHQHHQHKLLTSRRRFRPMLKRLLSELIELDEMIARGRKFQTCVGKLRSRRLEALLRRLSRRRGE